MILWSCQLWGSWCRRWDMRLFLPAKPIASSDRMTHSERSEFSTPGQSCPKVFTEEVNCSLEKSLKARLVPHQDWHLESAEAASPAWGTTFNTPFNILTDSHAAAALEGHTLFRRAAGGASFHLLSSFISPQTAEQGDGKYNYFAFHTVKVQLWLIWQHLLQSHWKHHDWFYRGDLNSYGAQLCASFVS